MAHLHSGLRGSNDQARTLPLRGLTLIGAYVVLGAIVLYGEEMTRLLITRCVGTPEIEEASNMMFRVA
ncbi:MAG: hypothetical protein ABSC90_05860 [Acidimicrobiales bacterium]|jgi:hypothetical protein